MAESLKKQVRFSDKIEIIGYSEPEIDIQRENEILNQLLKPVYNEAPKKLQNSSPFLANLQKVMSIKWQEKSEDSSEESQEKYVKDEKTGKWISQSQKEAKEKLEKLNSNYFAEDKN